MRKIVFALPHAGGGALSFAGWEELIDGEFYSFDYSGHWTRSDEPFDHSINELVDDIVEKILSFHLTRDDQIILFGHSMGGVVAWFCASKLISEHKIIPEAVCISGTVSLRAIHVGQLEGLVSDQDFLNFLVRLKQVPEKVLDNEIFFKVLLPAARNDFKLLCDFASGSPDKVKKIESSIFCFIGDKDEFVDLKGVQDWKNYTASEFKTYQLRGNHFYLRIPLNRKKVCRIINNIFASQNN